MQSNIFVGSIDFRGRMVIPKRIRDIMQIETYDRLKITYVDGKILIEKFESSFA